MKKTSCVKGILPIGRFSIPYRIYESEGPQFIFINGVQQSMAMWQSFVARFSPYYRIILFDFPNQGKARIHSGSSQVSLDEQVEILLSVMNEAGFSEDGTVCAASWGGVIATALAARYPDKVKRMILASLGTKPNQKMIETIRHGASMSMDNREQMAKALIKSFGEALPEQMKKGIINQFRIMKKESLQAFYEHGLFVISSDQLSKVVNLRKIKAKTILINGENDTIVDLDDVKFLASQIPDCELRIVKDVGHFLHMERDDVLDAYEDIFYSQGICSQPKKS